jgi:exoribonuclease R
MVSVYMPDERISMFPYTLSTELLSLGAGLDSYALSCGVTLDELGVCLCVCVCV